MPVTMGDDFHPYQIHTYNLQTSKIVLMFYVTQSVSYQEVISFNIDQHAKNHTVKITIVHMSTGIL